MPSDLREIVERVISGSVLPEFCVGIRGHLLAVAKAVQEECIRRALCDRCRPDGEPMCCACTEIVRAIRGDA